MSDSAYMSFTDDDSGLEFRWHGGEYIDVGYTATLSDGHIIHGHGPGDFVAGDCINVWDHAKGEAEISGFDEFEATCREWLEDQEEDE